MATGTDLEPKRPKPAERPERVLDPSGPPTPPEEPGGERAPFEPPEPTPLPGTKPAPTPYEIE